MFDNLSDRLQAVFSKLTGRGTLSEADVDAAMREVRMALLEADVNVAVVKDFVARVRERAVGADVMKSLTPGQMVVKIVNEELTTLMGGTEAQLVLTGRKPNVVMLVGLQGSGKTTTAAKLARLLRKQGRRPLLVAGDVYRPAAVDQLVALGKELDMPVFTGAQHARRRRGRPRRGPGRHRDRRRQGRGPEAQRRRHRGHRRAPARRRGDDGRGRRDQGGGQARTRCSSSSTR